MIAAIFFAKTKIELDTLAAGDVLGRSIHRGSEANRFFSADGNGVASDQRKSPALSSQPSSPSVSAIKTVSALLWSSQ